MSWFGDWDERNLLKIRSEWIHLFSAEKQARKAHKRIHKAANLFQTNLQNHAQSLLKVKHLKEHFQSVFPPRWADVRIFKSIFIPITNQNLLYRLLLICPDFQRCRVPTRICSKTTTKPKKSRSRNLVP